MVPRILAFACLGLWSIAMPAGAELYKWVDADGNIHFSDAPPRGSNAVDLHGEGDGPGEAGVGPSHGGSRGIAYEGRAPSRLAYLKQVMVHFEGVPPGRQKEIGEMRSGSSCDRPQPIRIKSGHALKREASLRWHFHELLRDLGYRSPREIKTTFDAEHESGSDLSIIAVITELEVSECVASSGSSSRGRSVVGSRARYGSSSAPSRVKNESDMTVEWQVRDNLKRRVVYETTTRGAFRDRRFVDRTDDMPGTLERAFLAAAEALLSEPAFVALLESGSGTTPVAARSDDAPKLSLPVEAGRCNGRGPAFGARYDALKDSTATIRTSFGHGSGFLVSEEGFVLTNEHVVGESRDVLVILGGEEYDGRVVASDPVRDVALVELEELPPSAPLAVCRARVGVGDTVYVIGTPLDEKLSLTVTKGIISQHRTMREQPFYQTDAVINQGNSGGPALNEQGEVVGIAVAGIFAKDGAGMGINYLIPIDEALSALISSPASRGRR